MSLFGKKKDAIGLPRPFDAAEIGLASMVVKREEVCAVSVDDDNEAKRYVLTIVFKNGGSVSRKLDIEYPCKLSTNSLALLFGCDVFGFVSGHDMAEVARRIAGEEGEMGDPCRKEAELMISMFAKADPLNQGVINHLLESIGYCIVRYAGKFVAVPEKSIVFPNQEAK